MLTMSQINHIKDLSNCGYRISELLVDRTFAATCICTGSRAGKTDGSSGSVKSLKKQVLIPKRYASILHRMISHRSHPLSRRSHPSWIPSSPSSRSGWTKTRNIGESSTIPLRESMSVSWRNMAIPGVTASSSAT